MKLSFTTLGCPKWDLPTILAKGREYGFDGIVLEHEKRWIPALPEPDEIFPKFVRWARSLT